MHSLSLVSITDKNISANVGPNEWAAHRHIVDLSVSGVFGILKDNQSSPSSGADDGYRGWWRAMHRSAKCDLSTVIRSNRRNSLTPATFESKLAFCRVRSIGRAARSDCEACPHVSLRGAIIGCLPKWCEAQMHRLSASVGPNLAGVR